MAMKAGAASFEDWSVTSRVYGPINRLSETEIIEEIIAPAEGYSEEIEPRLKAAYTVMRALRLCQPDFFADEETALAIDRTVGLAARQTVDAYPRFGPKEQLKQDTRHLDEERPAVLDCIDHIAETGGLSSDIRGLSEAIIRHIYKNSTKSSD